MATPSRRPGTNRIVETSGPGHRSRSYGTDTARLTAAPAATEVRGFHTSVVSTDRAVAVPPRLVEGLQPGLKVAQIRLTIVTALHFQVSYSPIQVDDVALTGHTASGPHTTTNCRHIGAEFRAKAILQTMSGCGGDLVVRL